MIILAYVLGTDLDTPSLEQQSQMLLDAGVILASSSTNTGLLAREFICKGGSLMSQSLFSQPLNVINVGIAMFSDDLKKQHVEVTQLDWTPPGQGNMQVVQALDNIADSPLADKIAAANQQALERIIQSHPVLIGFEQAINVVPGMTPKPFFTPGRRSPKMRRDERRGHRSAGVRRTGERSRRGG